MTYNRVAIVKQYFMTGEEAGVPNAYVASAYVQTAHAPLSAHAGRTPTTLDASLMLSTDKK